MTKLSALSNDNWQPSCKGYCNLPWETTHIASSLITLHHYSDNPSGYVGLLRDILEDAESRLKLLDKKNK